MSTTPDNPGDSLLMQWIRDHLTYPHDYCLIWPFAKSRQGYGSFGRDGKSIYAHRYICELTHGPAPTPGHQAVHSCGRGHDGCVNPRHLEWKTPAENQLDRGGRPWRYKLSAEQALEIRRVKDIEYVTETALRFGVTEANVRQIQAGKTWRAGEKWQRRFTPEEVVAIRASKRPARELAAQYEVGNNVIWRIRKGETYKYVSAVETADRGDDMSEEIKTLEDFREACASHDLTYSYSDDGEVWRRGVEREDRIRKAAGQFPREEVERIWNEIVDGKLVASAAPQFYWRWRDVNGD